MTTTTWLAVALLAPSLNLMSLGPCADSNKTYFEPAAIRYSTFRGGECHWNFSSTPDTHYDVMEWEPRGLVYYGTITPTAKTTFADGIQYWPRRISAGQRKSGSGRSVMEQTSGRRRVLCSSTRSYVEYAWAAEHFGDYVTMEVSQKVVCNGVVREWEEYWTWDADGPLSTEGGWKDMPALWSLRRVE